MSDAVLLVIVSGIITLATIYLKARIDAKSLIAAALAKTEAAKVTAQLDKVEVKIDGRLTELLETTKLLAQAQGLAQGKAEGREKQKTDTQEFRDGAAAGLKIEAAKVDITTPQVVLGEKKKGDKPK